MKKRVFSAFVAGVTAAMFGVMYPEYIFIPDTYQYIAEKNCQAAIFSEKREAKTEKDPYEMLRADSDQIVISSRLVEFLADEGIVLWKNNNSDKADMQ